MFNRRLIIVLVIASLLFSAAYFLYISPINSNAKNDFQREKEEALTVLSKATEDNVYYSDISNTNPVRKRSKESLECAYTSTTRELPAGSSDSILPVVCQVDVKRYYVSDELDPQKVKAKIESNLSRQNWTKSQDDTYDKKEGLLMRFTSNGDLISLYLLKKDDFTPNNCFSACNHWKLAPGHNIYYYLSYDLGRKY